MAGLKFGAAQCVLYSFLVVLLCSVVGFSVQAAQSLQWTPKDPSAPSRLLDPSNWTPQSTPKSDSYLHFVPYPNATASQIVILDADVEVYGLEMSLHVTINGSASLTISNSFAWIDGGFSGQSNIILRAPQTDIDTTSKNRFIMNGSTVVNYGQLTITGSLDVGISSSIVNNDILILKAALINNMEDKSTACIINNNVMFSSPDADSSSVIRINFLNTHTFIQNNTQLITIDGVVNNTGYFEVNQSYLNVLDNSFNNFGQLLLQQRSVLIVTPNNPSDFVVPTSVRHGFINNGLVTIAGNSTLHMGVFMNFTQLAGETVFEGRFDGQGAITTELGHIHNLKGKFTVAPNSDMILHAQAAFINDDQIDLNNMDANSTISFKADLHNSNTSVISLPFDQSFNNPIIVSGRVQLAGVLNLTQVTEGNELPLYLSQVVVMRSLSDFPIPVTGSFNNVQGSMIADGLGQWQPIVTFPYNHALALLANYNLTISVHQDSTYMAGNYKYYHSHNFSFVVSYTNKSDSDGKTPKPAIGILTSLHMANFTTVIPHWNTSNYYTITNTNTTSSEGKIMGHLEFTNYFATLVSAVVVTVSITGCQPSNNNGACSVTLPLYLTIDTNPLAIALSVCGGIVVLAVVAVLVMLQIRKRRANSLYQQLS